MKQILSSLAQHAAHSPMRPALTAGRQLVTYGELWDAIQATASQLRQWFPDGERPLALAGDNEIAWVIADLACAQARIPCVPVPPFFNEEQRQHLLRHSGCAGLLLCQQGQLQHQPLPLSQQAPLIPSGCVKITYTSGTTGTPKGVCLSGEQLDQSVLALAERVGELGVTHHLCTLPLAVLLENLAGLYLPLSLGKQVSLLPLAELGIASLQQPEPARFIAALAASGADSAILLPATLGWLVAGVQQGRLLAQQWRLLALGGGKSSLGLLAQAEELGLPLFEGYGLSEVGSVVALNGAQARRLGSVGKPLSHVQVRLAEDGEVLIRGNAMLGYLGEPHSSSHGEWLATGDWGEFDADGFLFIQGRKKSTIVTGFGRNVAPEWLEAELAALPGLLQAFVYGDEAQGVQALLFAPGLQAHPQADEIITGLNHSLPDYARLTGWRFVSSPFTASSGELTANGRLRRDAILAKRVLSEVLS
ncbi:MAG: AMP-binding protein [Aeromonadaceae bacterium]